MRGWGACWFVVGVLVTCLVTASDAEAQLTVTVQPTRLRKRSGEQLGVSLVIKNADKSTLKLTGTQPHQVPTVAWRLLDATGAERASNAASPIKNAWLELGPGGAYTPYVDVLAACTRPLPPGLYRLFVHYKSPAAPGVYGVSARVISDLEITSPAVPAHQVALTLGPEVGCCTYEKTVSFLLSFTNEGCSPSALPVMTDVAALDVTDERGRAVRCSPPRRSSSVRDLPYGETAQEWLDLPRRCAVPPAEVGKPRTYKVRLRYRDKANGLEIDRTVTLGVQQHPHS